MARTNVGHAILTVTTVDVFVQTMQFIEANDLWDDTKHFLKTNGKKEMFFDYEVLHLFRRMLEQNPDIDPGHPVRGILGNHEEPWEEFCSVS
ncbi:MAG: hypothetical protein R3348_06430 [Xanthomonadales bacterium]|nr:hypothetical protein [Xanthomonadales bacterium]